jgi:transcription initiation factor IIF auxiliary subunit
LSLDNDLKLTRKYIEKVVYKLDKSYSVNQKEETTPPFLFSRTAFGSFIIKAIVYFKDWTNI